MIAGGRGRGRGEVIFLRACVLDTLGDEGLGEVFPRISRECDLAIGDTKMNEARRVTRPDDGCLGASRHVPILGVEQVVIVGVIVFVVNGGAW